MATDNQHPEELLAWYVNGTLTDSEQKQVESHLQSCTVCQREVEFLRTIQKHVRSEEIEGPGELSRKRLLQDIKKEKSSPGPRRWWEPWLAAAAVLIISVQTIVIIKNPGTDVVLPLGKSESDIKIRFSNNARIEEINKVLKSLNTQISSGPDEDNFYGLDVLDADKHNNPGKIKTVIKALSSHKNLQNYIDTD